MSPNLTHPHTTRGAYIYTSLNVYDLYTHEGDPQLIIISMHVGEIKFDAVPFATPKANVGMYSESDTLSLQILFVYFLALSYFTLQF